MNLYFNSWLHTDENSKLFAWAGLTCHLKSTVCKALGKLLGNSPELEGLEVMCATRVI